MHGGFCWDAIVLLPIGEPFLRMTNNRGQYWSVLFFCFKFRSMANCNRRSSNSFAEWWMAKCQGQVHTLYMKMVPNSFAYWSKATAKDVIKLIIIFCPFGHAVYAQRKWMHTFRPLLITSIWRTIIMVSLIIRLFGLRITYVRYGRSVFIVAIARFNTVESIQLFYVPPPLAGHH